MVIMFFFIFVAGVGLGAGGMTAYGKSQEKQNVLTGREKKELQELRGVVHRIDRVAYDNRDIAPELSFRITDEIARSKMKELE